MVGHCARVCVRHGDVSVSRTSALSVPLLSPGEKDRPARAGRRPLMTRSTDDHRDGLAAMRLVAELYELARC